MSDDVIEGRRVLWRWTVPPDMWTEKERLIGDIGEEYAIVAVDAPTGVMVMTRHDGQWYANPSARPVIAQLLAQLIVAQTDGWGG